MKDAVNRVIREREALEGGFPGSLWVSVTGHLLLLSGAVAAQWLFPKAPPLKVTAGIMFSVPAGGGGVPEARPAPVPPRPDPAPEAAPPAPEPPKIIKPPKEEPRPKKRGLPRLDAKKSRKPSRAERRAAARTRQANSSQTGSQTPGLGFGRVGPGAPGGLDPLGDWYMAGVQRKVWTIWTRQLRGQQLKQAILVDFTILEDGSVTAVRVVQRSPVALLNLAAQRAIVSAAPFGPLPRKYGTKRFTIQAVFKPDA